MQGIERDLANLCGRNHTYHKSYSAKSLESGSGSIVTAADLQDSLPVTLKDERFIPLDAASGDWQSVSDPSGSICFHKVLIAPQFPLGCTCDSMSFSLTVDRAI